MIIYFINRSVEVTYGSKKPNRYFERKCIFCVFLHRSVNCNILFDVKNHFDGKHGKSFNNVTTTRRVEKILGNFIRFVIYSPAAKGFEENFKEMTLAPTTD